MRLATLASVLLVLPIVGCATDDGRPAQGEDQLDWRSGGKGDGQSCDFDSMSAASFYDLFSYVNEASSSGDWYRIGLTYTVRATLTNGDAAELHVYFLADNRVIADYDELHAAGGNGSYVLNETIVVSHATIDTTRGITIAGIGSGTPVTIGGKGGSCAPGIAFTYGADLRSPGLAGKITQIQSARTSARVLDPDHLESESETAQRWFHEDVASGKIVVIHE